jgi:hypothetical protein
MREAFQLGLMTGKAAKRLKQTLAAFISMAEKMVDQTKRRMLKGEKVPAKDKGTVWPTAISLSAESQSKS